MPLDTKELSKEIIERGKQLKIKAKDMMCPLILGCYDRADAEADLNVLKENCISAGFPSSILLKDIPVDGKDLPYNMKFKLAIMTLLENNYTILPIFYIHPAIDKEGHGKGLISEFFDVINEFPLLRQFVTILKHPKAGFIEQLGYIHPNNIYEIANVKNASDKLITHLQGHESFVTYMIQNGNATKNLYIPESGIPVKMPIKRI